MTSILQTTIAGSLPKPGWLAETEKLWPSWRLSGDLLAEGKRDELLLAVLPGVELTPFDLQTPYLYWPNPTHQGETKIRGRDAQAFLFRAPADFTGPEIKVAAARAYLDSQFSVIMQTELLVSPY